MHHLVGYLKEKKQSTHIKKILSSIFECKVDSIGKLLSDTGEFDVFFENNKIDNTSNFCVEINIYIHNKELEKIFPNDFLFASKLSELLNEEVIISFENDDPYVWILIKNNSFFIVEEDLTFESYGINLLDNKDEISYEEAKNLFN